MTATSKRRRARVGWKIKQVGENWIDFSRFDAHVPRRTSPRDCAIPPLIWLAKELGRENSCWLSGACSPGTEAARPPLGQQARWINKTGYDVTRVRSRHCPAGTSDLVALRTLASSTTICYYVQRSSPVYLSAMTNSSPVVRWNVGLGQTKRWFSIFFLSLKDWAGIDSSNKGRLLRVAREKQSRR